MSDGRSRTRRWGQCGSALRCSSGIFVALVLLASALPTSAADQVLTSAQKKSAKSIEGKLIAPCCFRGTLDEHESSIAVQLRGEVETLVAQGVPEEEILKRFVDKYGERILAAPRAQGFNLLAYVMPFVGLAVGGVFILLFVRRAVRRGSKDRGARDAAQAPKGEFDESLRARLDEELARFEP